MKIDKILIAADDSSSSIRAVKHGYDLAAGLKAKVALLSVINGYEASGNVDAGIFPEQITPELKKDAEELLHQFKNDYGHGIDTEIFVPIGNVKKIILDTAQEWEAKVIVVGTHGRTGLQKLLMGSVAEHIIRHSPIPVFIVPTEKK